eukprot:TRINITY_DN1735_c0_g1_i1.p2 TRINITY_DN1735_c0_g1~~TRINITY_DN1735_c0_g1_i1.p2  ORF type:complete len:495 (-),score=96.04 TRINITY_DN1735_c0_g1_i1:3700-5184(-)
MLSRVIPASQRQLINLHTNAAQILQARFLARESEVQQNNSKYLPYLNDATDAFKSQTDAYFYPEDDPSNPYFLHSFFFRTLPHEQLQTKLAQQQQGLNGKINLTPLLGKLNLYQVDTLVQTLRQNPTKISNIESQEGALAIAKFASLNGFEDLKQEVLKNHKSNFLNQAMYWWEMEEWEISMMTQQELNEIVRQIATQPGLNEVNIPILRLHYRISQLEKKLRAYGWAQGLEDRKKAAEAMLKPTQTENQTISQKMVSELPPNFDQHPKLNPEWLQTYIQNNNKFITKKLQDSPPENFPPQLTQQQIQDIFDRKHTVVEQKLVYIQNLVQNIEWASKINKDLIYRKSESILEKVVALEKSVKEMTGPLNDNQNGGNLNLAEQISNNIIDNVQKLNNGYNQSVSMVYIMATMCYIMCIFFSVSLLLYAIEIQEELVELNKKFGDDPKTQKEKEREVMNNCSSVRNTIRNWFGGLGGALRYCSQQAEDAEKPEENN